VADALSRIAYTQGEQPKVDPQYLNVIEMRVPASTKWLNDVRKGYEDDTICGPVLEYLSNSDKNEDKKRSLKQSRRVRNEQSRTHSKKACCTISHRAEGYVSQNSSERMSFEKHTTLFWTVTIAASQRQQQRLGLSTTGQS